MNCALSHSFFAFNLKRGRNTISLMHFNVKTHIFSWCVSPTRPRSTFPPHSLFALYLFSDSISVLRHGPEARFLSLKWVGKLQIKWQLKVVQTLCDEWEEMWFIPSSIKLYNSDGIFIASICVCVRMFDACQAPIICTVPKYQIFRKMSVPPEIRVNPVAGTKYSVDFNDNAME